MSHYFNLRNHEGTIVSYSGTELEAEVRTMVLIKANFWVDLNTEKLTVMDSEGDVAGGTTTVFVLTSSSGAAY